MSRTGYNSYFKSNAILMRLRSGNPNQNILAEMPKSSKKSNEKPKNLYPFAPIRTETNSGAGQIKGYSLSDQHILSPINPKYDDCFLSDLRRFTLIVLKFKTCKTCVLNFRNIFVNLRKSDNISHFFWLIGDKICWSDKEQPVPRWEF